MDIKYIGSGVSAKAVVFYITDYITKSQLHAHVAYAALELAYKKLGETVPREDGITIRAKRLLQHCADLLISHQERSAQQVVSYLMDFEDHFTSHRYVNVFWTTYEQFVEWNDPSPKCYPARPVNVESEQGAGMLLDLDKESSNVEAQLIAVMRNVLVHGVRPIYLESSQIHTEHCGQQDNPIHALPL